MKRTSAQRATINRPSRLADQIQRDLAELIPAEVRNEHVGMVTVMSVQLTQDFAQAKVFVSPMASEPEARAAAIDGLNAASGYLHSLLYKRLHIHTVPRLHFLLDESSARGVDLSMLIDRAVASRAKDD
ncbi:30S ribosome-binding factor RbfA [soil metagenome]